MEQSEIVLWKILKIFTNKARMFKLCPYECFYTMHTIIEIIHVLVMTFEQYGEKQLQLVQMWFSSLKHILKRKGNIIIGRLISHDMLKY
jgi:hypothetical protein